jgi:hypothetical protein
MGKVVYHQFLGNRLYVVLLCLSVIGIPVAFVYSICCTVTIIEEIDEPSQFLEAWKQKNRHSLWASLFGAAKR